MSRPYRLNQFKPRPRTDDLGRECELRIEHLADEGSGLAYWRQRRVFVPGALPGEQVRVRIMAADRHGLHARLQSVMDAPHLGRVDPTCQYYHECGGCQLQHLGYDAQLTHRQEVAQRRLARIVPQDTWLSPVASQPMHYRHRVRLQAGLVGKQPALGFREYGGRRLVPVEECLQLQPGLNAVLPALRRLLADFEQPGRLEEVRLAQGEGATVALQIKVKSALGSRDVDRLADACREYQWLGELVTDTGKVLWQNLADQPLLRYPGDGDSGLVAGAGDFTQANPEINEAMRKDAVAWLSLDGDARVVEFFSGLGNFSFPLARTGCRLAGYELSATMVARANERAVALGYEQVQFHQLDLFATDGLKSLRPALAGCSHVLLDPPRAGARELCRTLAQQVSAGESGLSRLVYISCNSLMLSGDVEPLLAAGFRVERARVYDMFPQTGHFETMVSLTRD